VTIESLERYSLLGTLATPPDRRPAQFAQAPVTPLQTTVGA
jgi:hypothetical protein